MAKQRTQTEPTTEQTTDDQTALVEVPLGEVAAAEYLSRHVEVRWKTEQQKLAFRRVWRGLQVQGAKTSDGRPVTRPGDALRWLMEQIS